MANDLLTPIEGGELVELPKPFSMYQRPNLPSAATIMVIGEAPGADEEKEGVPFIGASGDLFNELAQISGFQRYTDRDPKTHRVLGYHSEFHVTNVFSKRPPNNDLELWTVNKTELKKLGFSEQGRLPQIRRRYLHPRFEPEVERLHHEIATVKPDLIIALGGTALWALTGDAKITQSRGNFFHPVNIITGEVYASMQCIASFHPAAILRKYDDRPILWADLWKARQHIDGVLPPPLARTFWIDPTLYEITEVLSRWMASPPPELGVDIETAPASGQITMIAFGTPTEVLCIPFWNKYALAGQQDYWATPEDEVRAWQLVREFGAIETKFVGQNFLYDHQYLLEDLDIRIPVSEDTNILQHSMQPELPKSLGFLASVYLNEPSWKFMRLSHKDDNKKDE